MTKPVVSDDLDVWEDRLEHQIASDILVPETEDGQSLGQGKDRACSRNV